MRRDVSGHVWPNAGPAAYAAAASSSSCSCAFTFGRRMKRRRIYMIIRCAPCGAGPRRTRLRGIKKIFFFSYFLNKNQVGLKGEKKGPHTRIKNSFAHARIIFYFYFGFESGGEIGCCCCCCWLSALRMNDISLFFIQLVNYKVWCVYNNDVMCREKRKKILGFYFFGCPWRTNPSGGTNLSWDIKRRMELFVCCVCIICEWIETFPMDFDTAEGPARI
jgi:hypothetical protein